MSYSLAHVYKITWSEVTVDSRPCCCTWEPVTCPCWEPDETFPLLICCFKINFNNIVPFYTFVSQEAHVYHIVETRNADRILLEDLKEGLWDFAVNSCLHFWSPAVLLLVFCLYSSIVRHIVWKDQSTYVVRPYSHFRFLVIVVMCVFVIWVWTEAHCKRVRHKPERCAIGSMSNMNIPVRSAVCLTWTYPFDRQYV